MKVTFVLTDRVGYQMNENGKVDISYSILTINDQAARKRGTSTNTDEAEQHFVFWQSNATKLSFGKRNSTSENCLFVKIRES